MASPGNGTTGGDGSSPHQLALLDFFFPGFSMFTDAVQRYAGIDLNLYIPLLAVLGGAIAAWQFFSDYIWRQVESYFMATVDIRTDDEIYNMLMAWVADQRFAKRARRFVANTNLNSRAWFLWTWDDDEEDDDEGDEGEAQSSRVSRFGGRKKKNLAYTPTFGSHYFFYRGHLCIFRRDRGRDQAAGFLLASEKEEISVSCFGRNPQVLKELLLDARAQFMKRDEAKTLIYRGTVRAGSSEATWQRMMARVSRPFSTVILNDKVKQHIIDDVTDYLNPATRRWYANRGIPYRRGYLLHGPPGTGKSSLSLALAGFFKMRIYIVSLSSMASTEENLAQLFSELPRRCVVLLEDIDSAGLTHTREEDKPQDAGSNGQEQAAPQKGLRGNEKANTTTNNNAFRLSLSGLLNILDGVASQEGRVLIMTTNHVDKLDKALIRPGRVDLTVEFGLADREMTASIFRAIFAPLEADDKMSKTARAQLEDASRDPDAVLKKLAADRAARDEVIASVDRLADRFAERIPAHEFSPAELQGFLLKNKRDPDAALAGAEAWVGETRKEKAAGKLKEAEEKREKEAEEQKKKEEEEKEKEKDNKKKEKKKKKRSKKGGSKKSRKSKKKEVSSSESDSSETSSSDSEASTGSGSESDDENKSKSKRAKSKSRKKATMEIKVSGGAAEESSKVGPMSAATDKSDGFVKVDGEECDAGQKRLEAPQAAKAGGSDSGYSTPDRGVIAA